MQWEGKGGNQRLECGINASHVANFDASDPYFTPQAKLEKEDAAAAEGRHLERPSQDCGLRFKGKRTHSVMCASVFYMGLCPWVCGNLGMNRAI